MKEFVIKRGRYLCLPCILSFTGVLLINKMHICNVHRLLNVDRCIYPWCHHHNQGPKHILRLLKCPCVLLVGVVRALNMRFMLLTYLKGHNTILLNLGIVFHSRSSSHSWVKNNSVLFYVCYILRISEIMQYLSFCVWLIKGTSN